MMFVSLQRTIPRPHSHYLFHINSTDKFRTRIFWSQIEPSQQFYKSYTFDTLPAQTIFTESFPTHFSRFHFMELKKVGKNTREWWYQTVALRIHSIWRRYGWKTKKWVSITGKPRFSLLYSVQCGSGAHPAHDPMCDGVLCPVVKWPRVMPTGHPPLVSSLKTQELQLHSHIISVVSRYISNKLNFTYVRISTALQASVVHDSPFYVFMYLVCRHYFKLWPLKHLQF